MCNRYKATRQSVEDPETEQLAPLFHPQQDDWHEHFSWSSDAAEIVGQTPTGRATIVALRMNRAQLVRVRHMWTAIGEHPPEAGNG